MGDCCECQRRDSFGHPNNNTADEFTSDIDHRVDNNRNYVAN